MVEDFWYLIFLNKSSDAAVQSDALTHEVAPSEQAYLRNTIIPRLHPLADGDYENGAHAILHTSARFSYVLSAPHVFWCIEWKPGLLVIRFAPDGEMDWCALRSPNPEFGGRTATLAEIEAFDERMSLTRNTISCSTRGMPGSTRIGARAGGPRRRVNSASGSLSSHGRTRSPRESRRCPRPIVTYGSNTAAQALPGAV